jgi:(2S)-methylsuccinyl-CoA dehydrogenase
MDTIHSDARTAAEQALTRLRALVGQVVSRLRDRVDVHGRIDDEALDRHQHVGYELAWLAAEVTAAEALMTRSASSRGRGDSAAVIEGGLALAFVADVLQRARARIEPCPADFGLTRAELDAHIGGESAWDFTGGQLAAGHLADLGRAVSEHGLGGLADGLGEEHRIMADTFRRISDEVIEPLAEAIHRGDELIGDSILGPLNEMGLFGLSIPERFGGLCSDEHTDTLGMILATAELSRGSLGAAGSLVTRPEIVARALLAGGTDAQQQRWLPGLAAGEPLCAVAVTEPDYGSDVAGMRLKATAVDGGWLLDGAKSWCTFGGKAGLLLVLARTEPDPSLGHRGLSLLLVDKPASEGREFEHTQAGGGRISGRAIATIGYRGMHSYDVFFDRWFVPADQLIGGDQGRGRGFYYLMSGFAGGRIQTAARALGVMQAAFDRARSYTSERQVFGQPIAGYQLTQVKLARMAMQLAASRALTFHVADLMDRGEGQMEASMVKLLASRTAERITREAMQLHGGMGYAEETAVSRYFVDARVLSIFEGAEEVLALRVITRGLVARVARAA